MRFGILGLEAPELSVADWITGDGDPSEKAFRLGDYTNKVRVIFAFQAWCPSCHTAGFPALAEVLEHYKGQQDVVFAAVQTVFEGHASNGPGRRIEMLRRYGTKLPVGQDEAFPRPSIIAAYRTGGTPWFIVINRQGKVMYNAYRLELGGAIKIIEAALEGAEAPIPEVATITESKQHSRFEITFPNGARGLTDYRRNGYVLDLIHTEIEKAHQGQGLGGWMMELVLEEIERLGLKARPVCAFTKAYLERYQRWHAIKA